MARHPSVVLAAAFAVFAWPGLVHAQQWKLSYAHDVPGEELVFADLAFPSAERGIAVGVVRDAQGRDRQAVALLTRNGGTTWNQVTIEEAPVSLFFLDEERGWMVTSQGTWKTQDSGFSWTRISRHEQGSISRVWFLDSLHGFAVGRQKTVLETRDGGTKWDPVPEAAQPTGNPDFTDYTHIAFADGQRGIIAGSGVPPGAANLPRQAPTLTVLLQTLNAGLVWTGSSNSLFGRVSGLKLGRAEGLFVYSYADTFEVPSEVYRLDLRTGSSTSVFRQKNRVVTDVELFDGRAFLAITEPKARSNPDRGNLRILTTADFVKWTEMKMDRRGKGSQVLLSGPDAEHLWAATDTGVILRMMGTN
jgi:hypothetical protein